MSDAIVGYIRTYVPIAVGTFVSWVGTQNVELDGVWETGAVATVTGLLIAIYYTGVRLLAKKWPAVEILLGSSKQPSYTEST